MRSIQTKLHFVGVTKDGLLIYFGVKHCSTRFISLQVSRGSLFLFFGPLPFTWIVPSMAAQKGLRLTSEVLFGQRKFSRL